MQLWHLVWVIIKRVTRSKFLLYHNIKYDERESAELDQITQLAGKLFQRTCIRGSARAPAVGTYQNAICPNLARNTIEHGRQLEREGVFVVSSRIAASGFQHLRGNPAPRSR